MIVTQEISADAPSDSARRTGRRKRVLMTATLMACDGPHKAQVKDVSAEGARVLVSQPIIPNSDAIFRRGTVFVAAKVAWSEANEVGLRFYRSLSEADLASISRPAIVTTALP